MNEEDDIEKIGKPEQEPFGVPLDEKNTKTPGKSSSGGVSDEISDEEYFKNLEEQAARYPQTEASRTMANPQAQASATPVRDTSAEKLKTKENIPGGKVSDFMRRIPGLGRTKKTSAEEAKTGGVDSADVAKKAGKQLANKAAEAVKALGKKAVQAVIKGGPVVWIIVGVGLILLVIFFIVGLSYIGSIGKNVSFSGGTPLRAVSAKDNTGEIVNVLKLSGDKTVAGTAINESVSAMKKNILEAKELSGIKGNLALEEAATSTTAALDSLASTQTPEAAQTALTALGNFYNLLEGEIPVWPSTLGPTRLPVAGTVTSFNTSLHGYSFLNNSQVDNHNVYIRSNDGKEMCDAVDIGVTTGETIYPIFGGKVTDVSGDGNAGDIGKKVVVTSNDGKYTALYAHLQNPPKAKGAAIVTTDPIGTASTSNIQIEIFYNDGGNSCLVTNHADLIDHAMNTRRHQDWGGYLWDRIVKTFNLK